MYDIVISFDTTGSMYPCLAEVRRMVQQFTKTIFTQLPDLQVGIIAHGDYCDDPAYTHRSDSYIVKEFQLSNDVDALCDFVRTIRATGGGDSDECYEYVLYAARTHFAWREDAHKIMIVIGDAEPHERLYRYRDITVALDWRQEIESLLDTDIRVYPVQCLANRYSRSAFYKRLAERSNVPHLQLSQFSNIIPLLTAVAYKQQSNEVLQTYAEGLESEGLVNRDIAQTLDALLGADYFTSRLPEGLTSPLGSSKRHDTPYERYSTGRYPTKPAKGLIAVEPSRFQKLHVDTTTSIKDFVESTGATFRIGKGFYELTKREMIQQGKEVVLVDRNGDMFTGTEARDFIGLPYGERGNIVPPEDKTYSVFVQSTSSNRKLMGATQFLYEVERT